MSDKIAIFGGSFNPPGLHHRAIVEHLAPHFQRTIVVPCGPRPDKPTTTEVAPIHRAVMADLNFRGLPNVEVDLFDLEESTFTRTHALEHRYRHLGELWHVVGADLVAGGARGESVIQQHWANGATIWKDLQFAVVTRAGSPLEAADLPPRSRRFEVAFDAAATEVRSKVFHRQQVDRLL